METQRLTEEGFINCSEERKHKGELLCLNLKLTGSILEIKESKHS